MSEAVRMYNDYDPPPPVLLVCEDPSLARQSEARDCDINVLMARYEKTGVLPVQQQPGFFADVSEFPDYRSVLDHVRSVQEYFGQLPARIRAEFENDAAAFLDFVSDDGNREKMVELGLLPEVSSEGNVVSGEGAVEAPAGEVK